ncbi:MULTISPECIES: DJ-1 family glyoxalase III [unclassified Campylobacter]|uniref:DJ-1 family glyoxalase III n=1 Tax=unclassified Campylobacter TaxID=2593542 RepID=UPI001237E41A|nr:MULTISPECIES: DJ-1 family glyoxalase III [unclassified Campylobacter]KAA6225405.1 DJ-1 family protein [Campylobacter sp. LR185c]KAA6227101.1 DJ-1 family protein [Campylobacter sp. LR196d]KAA6227646.1 DJ-1 family protein [Campylobacter sp. LR286c]KAA6229583.1 DJ-1 family protein [Campylobacter sp. LR264d]KAA8605008.1 DJ-1 family protein [Campylobacter sp. LR185c]
MKKVMVALAQGFEEAEFIGIIDVLRRASELDKNLQVFSVALNNELLVKGANDVYIKADMSLNAVNKDELAGIVLPGGFEGMQNLKADKEILSLIKKLHSDNKIVAAICAAPIVLNEAGVLSGEFTCYPSCEAGLQGTRINKAVVKNGNVITAAGPGVAILFGLELAKIFTNENVYQSLYEGLLIPLTK